MSSSILTNNGAMVALQTMKSINKDLGGIQDMISTGKKVADAKDNAAVWAISTVMESDVSSFKAVGDSLALGQSTVAVARNATEQVTDLLEEMKTKIISAQEDNVDRAKIQDDVSALRDQITSVVAAAQFNGLNLLKGSEDVNILSSLDRDSSGNVTTSDITVSRNNLETNASVFGSDAEITETSATALDNNSLAVTDKLNVENSAVIAFTETAYADGESVSLEVAGQTFTVSFTDNTALTFGDTDSASIKEIDGDSDDTAVASAFATLINDAITSGVLQGSAVTSVSASLGELTIDTQSATETAFTISGDANGGVAFTGEDSDANELGSGATSNDTITNGLSDTITAVKDTLTLSAGVPNEGDSYRIAFDGNDYEYVAKKGENLNDIANGLKSQLDAGGIADLTVTVNQQSDPGTNDVTIDLQLLDGSTTDKALTTYTDTGGTAGGGLEELADIDVSTEAGATAALVHIEDLIQTSIDAAASFGSDEKRLEIQQDFISKLTDSMTSGIGSMVDANMEETAARLQALQVQQQLGTQALSIANQAPQNILALFR